MKETINGNKLIAEFMGRVANPNDGGNTYTEGFVFYDEKGGIIGADGFSNPIYNKSWDWLMPVVEKIESVKEYVIFVQIIGNACNISTYAGDGVMPDKSFSIAKGGTSKISAVWLAVIEFINWYNSTK